MTARRGVFVFVLVFALMGAAVLTSSLAMHAAHPGVPQSFVLHFEVPSSLEECELPMRPFSFAAFHAERMTLWDVVHALRRAADDDRVTAVVVEIDGIDWGWAKIAEVRSAIQAVRAEGKPVYASLSGGGEREYLLASAADRICVPPSVTLQLDGLSASALYMRGALDKFGVTPNFLHVGRYKSAIEAYTRTGGSESARVALESLLDDEYSLLVDTLGAARHLAPDSVRALLDAGPWDAEEARAHGLIDTLMHAPDVDSMASRLGHRHVASMTMLRYAARLTDYRDSDRIALVTASGTIASGRSRESPGDGRITGSETLIEALRQARTSRAVKAIVLRVDSPGGSADASDAIWREVERCREQKPVVVSMSDLAASGGYFIAMGGWPVFAQPGTITGSIGVFGGKFNISGLLHKFGLEMETTSRGRHAQMFSPFEDFTPEETAIYQRHLDRFYQLFLARVSKARGLSIAEVDSVAQGRVWSGLSARPRGLVDRFGGLQEAIAEARQRAHIASDVDVAIEVYPRSDATFLTRMLSDLFDDDDTSANAALALPPVLQAWLAATRFPAGATLALMPYTIEIR